MPTIRDVRATLKFLLSHPLSCDNRLRTLIRFARWQIGTRLISDAVIHDWVNGARFICRRGETGLTGNIYCGLHEFAGMAASWAKPTILVLPGLCLCLAKPYSIPINWLDV